MKSAFLKLVLVAISAASALSMTAGDFPQAGLELWLSAGQVEQTNGVITLIKDEIARPIGLTSVDPSAIAWGACLCAAAGASGAFTIPPAILANLPASQSAPAVPALPSVPALETPIMPANPGEPAPTAVPTDAMGLPAVR